MTNASIPFAGTPSISAMDLRGNPGTILDRVDYRQETFIVERAGKPKAVLIPVPLFQMISKARERLTAMNREISQTFKDVSPIEIESEIKKAIKDVRKNGAR